MNTVSNLFTNGIRSYGRICEIINFGVKIVLFLFFSMVLVLIAFQILSRYFLGISIVWIGELAGISLVLIGMWGSSSLIFLRSHISVTFLVKKLDVRIKHTLEIIGMLILIAYMLVFVIYGWEFSLRSEGRFLPAGVFPVFYVRMLIPSGALLIILQSINIILQDILSLLGTERE